MTAWQQRDRQTDRRTTPVTSSWMPQKQGKFQETWTAISNLIFRITENLGQNFLLIFLLNVEKSCLFLRSYMETLFTVWSVALNFLLLSSETPLHAFFYKKVKVLTLMKFKKVLVLYYSRYHKKCPKIKKVVHLRKWAKKWG